MKSDVDNEKQIILQLLDKLEDYEKLDDAELCEIAKSRMNDGQQPIRLTLDDL